MLLIILCPCSLIWQLGKVVTMFFQFSFSHLLRDDSSFFPCQVSYMTGKLLLKLESVKFIIANHSPENFPFLAEYKCSRSRTTFYYILGSLVFMEDSPVKFRTFMEPLQQVAFNLEATPDAAFRTDVAKHAFIGLMRDLRGIAIATNSRKTYGLLFDWLYPSRMPLLLRAISLCTDEPAVVICSQFVL